MQFGERYTRNKMDEYDKKFAEMQKYIPFLEAMIERLQNVKDKSREIQLQKMQSLHGILSNSKRKLKIETLQRCEDVLQKLHNKVEKGNTPGLHFPNKKGEMNSVQPLAIPEKANVDQNKMKQQQVKEVIEENEIHETPASPSPPVSPDSGSQAAPIIIPTERSLDFVDDKSDSKPASPDLVETVPTKAPIIIPTERTNNALVLSSNFSSSKTLDEVSFSEWEMLEESEQQNARNKSWQPHGPSSHDTTSTAKLAGNNLPPKVNEGRPHVPVPLRHIPTIPIPSLGSCRRLSSVLEKNRLPGINIDATSSDSRPESPTSVSDVRLKSPDSEMLFQKHKSTSPRLKDGHGNAKASSKPPAPLLLSPPPVSTEPPLSMEDLAELLSEESDGKSEKKNEKFNEEALKFKKDTNKQEQSTTGIGGKDTKASKPFLLTQDDIDRESERRWEEIDKHIVKLTSRKCLPSVVTATSTTVKADSVKSNEIKGPKPSHSMYNSNCYSMNAEKVVDNRNRPSSPSSKMEPRYADNYERHPRQSRDSHSHDNFKDKVNTNVHCRVSDDDMANPIPVHHAGSNKLDDRNATMYPRRQVNVGPDIVPPRIETEFRMEGPDYFNRPMPNANHWPPIHPPVNNSEFCNNQWPAPNNFGGIPNSSAQPIPYQHPMGMHQDMWNMGTPSNPIHMDPHPNDAQLRSNQFPPNMNTSIRPLMSPTARPPDICHNPRPDNIREDLPNMNVSAIQPLISPTGFPVGPQYRNFQGENRPYEPVFDRGMEYPHARQSWDSQPGRTNDVPYRGETEVPCGIINADSPAGPSAPYSRPSTPCPWNRDRDRCNRGRGRDTFYNDRNRGEIRSNFNRDARRSEWSRDGHGERDNCNRFNRDARNLSERDPRVRMEHNVANQNQNQLRDNNCTSARDPRLAKDKHPPIAKNKDPVYNERDPRKRQVPPPLAQSPRKGKEKLKSPPKSSDNHRRPDSESSGKHAQDKLAKDKMQSPLESLYGVIDTKAKSAQGYCLQNFKIPKIKRTEPSESPTPSNISEEVKSSSENKLNTDKQEGKTSKNEVECQREKQSTEKDGTIAEVSSSSDSNILLENWNGDDTISEKKEDTKEETPLLESTDNVDKNNVKIGEADSITVPCPKSSETSEIPKKEDSKVDGAKSKEEVTQEWIESLIRKSFEFGEGKRFVEQAKLMQKLGEVLQAKKLKKIKKIIDSETESSSSSDKDETLDSKKTRVKRKRRIIVSDSSDEESLAERLGILNTTTNKEELEDSSTSKNDANKDTPVKDSSTTNVDESKDDTVKEECSTAQKTQDTVQTITSVKEETCIKEKETTEVKNEEESKDKEVSKLGEELKKEEEVKHEEVSKPEKLPEHEEVPKREEILKQEEPSKQEEQPKQEEESKPEKKLKEEPKHPEELKDAASKNEPIDDADNVSKVPKAKAKRRNSLEMLQEDIREMFISEGVVTATGHRQCRVQKENQTNVGTTSTNLSTPISKKDDVPIKRDAEVNSDSEEPTVTPVKPKRTPKSRGTDESNKSKCKPKKEVQRITRQRSKQYAESSDSEEDQPLALRTEIIQNSSILSNQEKTDTCSEETDVLRRSTRVLGKDAIKEPRVVVEKTDITKLECSKVMFDSSSDESFGIDVSELAAAVDISLHPEKQSESITPSTVERRKRDKSISKKSSKKKKKQPTSETKGDDASLTDAESIVSDISMSSSVTSGKKMNIGTSKVETTNEELLSNILVGLVPTKTDPGKEESVADKGSDADVDDDVADQLPMEQNTKKGSSKKKKKKCNWQMGILSKKKRRRTATSSSPKIDTELNTTLDTDSSMKIDNSLPLEDAGNDGMEVASFDKTGEASNEKPDNNIKDTCVSSDDIQNAEKTTDPLRTCDSPANSKESLCKVPSTPKEDLAGVKDVQDVPSSLSSNNIVEKSVTKSKEDAYDEITEKAFSNLNIKTLMDYAWTGKERYKCLLCLFTGKNIVHHYKLNHPGKEILISRLRATDAHLAIQDAKERNVEAVPMELLPEETCKFHCRFCSFFIEGTMKVAVEAFYEHCTTHTGEYRFECKHCCYQSVAKSSMRTHYYKNCRLLNFDSFGEAVTEDEVPKENSVYGYLCSNCNYVQLKKTNVQKHLEFWHQNDSNTTIVKINMSVDKVKEGTAAVSADEQMKVVSPLTTETQEVTIRDNTGNADKSHVDEDTRQEQVNSKEKCAVADEKAHDCNPTEPETKVEQVTAACDNDESQISLQADPEVPLPTGKLSVFVCPPELEKKEVEIQLERKRKMQEIIENIGIKLQKDTTKKGLSIIDKLKDKMKSNLPAGSTQNEHDVDMDSCTKTSPNRIASASPVLSRTSNVEILHTNPEVTLIEDSEVSSSSCQDNLITDKRTDDTTIISLQVPNAECDSQTAMQADKLDTKVRDPLMIVERKKNYDSELETSDNENMRVSVPVYESDSSSEQSDSELPTDVNTLLKETSNIAASSKDPMITTIQRLAAQLQATKPLEIRNPGSSRKPRAVITQISPATSIPKPPNVVPIANIKRFVGKLETRYHEVSSEMQDDTNPPKNFIRLRRLSGDKLSVPVQSSSIQEDVSPFNDGDQSNAANRMETILHTGDEECSFLKIENVVSLAPRADNNVTESPIINDIRKAVETSPVKSKGVSVLKKSNSPLILKRLNTVTITQPMSKNMQTIQPSNSETVKLIPVKSLPSSSASITTTHLATNFVPIAPKSKIIQLDNKLSFPLSVNKTSVIAPVTTRTVTVTGSSTSSNLNYKIVKVVRTPTIIKPKEAVSQPTAIKLKSADAYNVMLKSVKLIHLYKCMARDCRFTTDIPGHYQQHYLQHAADAEKRKSAAPFDYQKCAYCYMVLDDWNQMKIHIEEKHAHCRYQCKYCFYRAISLSYVQIHQTMSHPGYHGILFGKFVKDPPTKEEINRHDYIHPFVCQHECGKFFYVPEAFTAHLKTKHGSGLSVLKCHLCRATCMKAEQLVSHYKMHGLYKYQCLYCLNGSDTYNNMFIHLSTFHCNRLPQILERSLPPQPVRSKDVIDQLLVRTVDEKNFKNNDYVIEVDSDKKDSKESIVIDVLSSSPSHKTASPSLPKEITVLDKDEQTSLEKSVSKLRDLNGNSNISPNAKSINTVLKQSDKPSENESCGDTSTNKAFGNINSESKNLGTSISNKQCPDNSLTKSAKSIASFFPSENLEESVEFSGGFDCSDEFVNINLLDNPDFFKNVSNHSSDASSVKNITALIENKNDDSDIEIVDIDDAESNTATDMKTVVDVNKENSFNMNEKSSDRISNQKADVENNKVSSSGTDNKSTLDETHENSSNTVVAKSDVPLTLEDIKDTGFTGRKLYKCGYESCNFGASTAALLRIHVKECLLRSDSKNLNCAHCNKRFVKIGFLLEHLKLHGLKRFGCSLCKMRCTVGYQAMAHMKAKHKFPTSKLVPADPKNPSADGLFIVQPVNQTGERKGKKRKRTKSIEKDCEKIDTEKLSFSPDEIELLPRQAIYNREVQCAVCPYTTKVRTNIVRHLQLHAKDESVPESGPVNPVPCLDKKERMFDKMVNLASSSHQNGRMGGKVKEVPKDSDDELIPKFVPEHKRYVCGVAECNYLTVDEAMLRYHLKALHSEEPYFRCPHCPQPPPGQESLNIAIDKMGVHLKMHDTRLYKCSHCNHHHYHRHVVERHLTDKHPEKRPFVKVIRELESTENNQQTVQDEVEEEVPDPDGNHWKCNICEYKCVYKAEMVNHASTAHDEKCQFKCTLCSFKTSGKIMFEQHINSKHSNDATVDYIMIYQRIKGVNKKSTDTVEQSTQEEPFDTTPLWRRDMPRIRHIRGILLEEENETESSLKPTKRKSEVELPPVKPAKVKSGKPGSLDDTRQSKEKSKRSLSCEQITVESENSCETLNTQKKSDSDAVKDKLPKESKLQSAEDNESDEWGGGRFGPYGKPDGNMYVCTLCTQFKSKYKHDMRDHLYRELNYARWHCKECGYLSVNRNALLKHFTKHHPGEHPDHEPLSPDHDIEDWVSTLLKKQTCIIKATISKQNNNSKDPSMTSSTAALTSTDNDKNSTTKDTQSSTNKYVKTIDLTPKPTNLRDNSLQGTEINIDVHDDDSKDNETITNDPKEESPLKKEKSQSIAEPEKGTSILEVNQEKPLTCKHCKMIFSRWRGFKLHVQLTHLKRLGFLCPYCDRSTNSETLMRQHIRSKHPGCVEKIVQNPAAGGPELTDDFWQKEYGIVFPKKSSKKRKRRASGEDNNADNENNCDQSELQEKCTLCAFKAMNLTGLKAHMRIHTTKNNLKCTYCTFTATMKSELWDHWEVNHPFTTFKLEDTTIPGSSDESGSAQNEQKYTIDDYSDDIEEESVPDIRDDLTYCCFYCSLRSKSLEVVRNHWSVVHKESKLLSDPSKLKPNLPFRYKELLSSKSSSQNPAKKAPCPKKDTEHPYDLYLQHSQNEVQMIDASGTNQEEGWVCQWCNELCDSETNMKAHQNMFHSHLPLNFKKQGSDEAPKGYACPECSFTTTFINIMKTHVSKHINLFKCKYCDKTFSTPSHVSSHNVEKHPELELKIESIQNYDVLIDKIMAKVKWYKSVDEMDRRDTVPAKTPKNHAVAKKSTARSTVLASSIPSKVKAVARKSTNPYSRHLSNLKLNESDKSTQKFTTNKQFSYYGAPKTSINLTRLNTYMVVGGHRMKVNCTTLAQLININPKVVLKDLKHDIKNIPSLSQLK